MIDSIIEEIRKEVIDLPKAGVRVLDELRSVIVILIAVKGYSKAKIIDYLKQKGINITRGKYDYYFKRNPITQSERDKVNNNISSSGV